MMREAAGDGFPMDEYKTLWYKRWLEYLTRDGIPLKSGLALMLAWLEGNGVPRAVVTSTHAGDAETCLQGAGVRTRFEHVITGDQVAHNKPAPDIYLEGARRLGIEPERCIALEDSTRAHCRPPRPVCASSWCPTCASRPPKPAPQRTRSCLRWGMPCRF